MLSRITLVNNDIKLSNQNTSKTKNPENPEAVSSHSRLSLTSFNFNKEYYDHYWKHVGNDSNQLMASTFYKS